MAKKFPYRNQLKSLLPDTSLVGRVDEIDEDTAKTLVSYFKRPNSSLYVDRTTAPHALNLSTSYGNIHFDHTLTRVDGVYINGVRFDPVSEDLGVLSDLIDGNPLDGIEKPTFSNSRRRGRARRRTSNLSRVPFEEVQERGFEDLSKAKLTYQTLFTELGDIIDGRDGLDLSEIMNELRLNAVDQDDIPRFLVYESSHKYGFLSRLYGGEYGADSVTYNFEPITKEDNAFLGRLMDRLGVEEMEYDTENRTARVGERLITNLPHVDERGIFHTDQTSYLPYHIAYFAEGEGSRVDRLRHVDPVESALQAVELHYKLTQGDIRFKTILDVTRNLNNLDNHPYADEILDTLKRKVVFDKSYAKSNSLLAEYQNQADDLGAVALTMLDEDAKGLIDPLGTSNGSNLGRIFYLTEDAQFNPDGTFTKGELEHSPVGRIMKEFHIDTDNFNRNQMSFNAFLTSTDVKQVNVAYTEFAMWNAEDALVLTDKGADKLGSSVGDKVMDMHGNKSVSSLVIDSTMDEETAASEQLTHAVAFAKLNPDLDMIVSPVSLASRLNMGVAHEGLTGEKKDLHLPDGSVVKDGITQVTYMTLPQTAEHKSKDYGVAGNGRKYSTLFRHALSSKVGDDLYRKGLIDEKTRDQHIDVIAANFGRLGIGFDDDKKLLADGNVNNYVKSPVTIDRSEFEMKPASQIREKLLNEMVDGQVNIDLGSFELISPITKRPILDEQGRNVLPIRVAEGETIPYRYHDVFKQLAVDNREPLQIAYNKAVAVDYSQLTTKNNLLKNIDTMTFFDGAKTEMITPDPRLKLGQIRTSVDSSHVIAHRDPCVQSGNVISMENVGGNADHMTHINPLMVVQIDGDFDSDTMGINSYNNLNLSDDEKQDFFNKSSVYEQLNRYGEVFLSTGGSHFKAGVVANGIDDSQITFADGKSNEELATIVESINETIVNSSKSYGAYAISFTDEHTVIDSLGKLADDGIKGDREDMIRHFKEGYTDEENKNVAKALIAKSEWTGLAGATTNKLIAGFGDNHFDQELTRVAMDVTYSMTQSVLQMKKNADKLTDINNRISWMKIVMDGNAPVEESRNKLLEVTEGLAPVEAVNKFVDLVVDRQKALGLENENFGVGVISQTGLSNVSAAFMSAATFDRHLSKLSKEAPLVDDYVLTDDDLMKLFDENAQEVPYGYDIR